MKTPGLAAGCRLVDEELDRRFAAPGSPLSEQARRHLEECERCRKLADWIERGSSPSAPSLEFCAAVQNNLSASLKPVAPRRPAWVIAGQFGAIFVLFAILAIGIIGPAEFDEMSVPQIAGTTVVFALGITLFSICLAWQMIPGSLPRLSAGVFFALIAAGFAGGIVLLFPWHAPEPFFARGWPCLGMGVGLALPAGLLFWLVARRGAALGLVRLGGTLGAIAGLVGVSVLQFTCDRQEGEHLLFWHGGVLVVSAAAGVLIAYLLSLFFGEQRNLPQTRAKNK
jgi:MFS family permease